jgi:2-oxoglutarate dehydrogenase E1 component
VFHDLRARRDSAHADVAVLRVEQLSPFPTLELEQLLATYDTSDVVWVQEEPENAGAAEFIRTTWRDIPVIARLRRGSPATGTKVAHDAELESLLLRAFS